MTATVALEYLVVALICAAAFVYALAALLPVRARRALATHLTFLPGTLRRRLDAGRSCDSCPAPRAAPRPDGRR